MTDPYYKANPGDPITADDWNNMQRKLREAVHTHSHEGGDAGAQLDGDAILPTARLKVNQVDAALSLTVRNVDVLDRLNSLEKQKLPVTGGTLTGPLSVSGNTGIGTTDPKARLELRGTSSDASASALKVTNASGANLLEVRNDGATALFDKPLYLRAMGDAFHGIAFAGNVDGPSVFGNQGGQLASDGGKTAALKWSKSNVTVQGDLFAGNSALYFTQPEHNHSGVGNTLGFAAIENAKDHDALMILGRATAKGRVVKLWDRLEVVGNQAVTGTVGIGTAAPPNKRLTIDNPVNNHANLELRQSGGQSWGVGLVLNTVGGTDGAAMMFRSRQKNWQLRGENGAAATGFQIAEDGGDAEYGSGHGIPRVHIKAGGDIGVGTTDPQSKLDIQGAPRTGTHPKGRALYVTGEFGEADGVEFRHSNGTQGIGFGHNAIYATGSNPDQDLNLRSRGAGIVRVERKLPKGGKVVFLELVQHDTTKEDVHPSIRFHHAGRHWSRIEASNGRFHFKDGNPDGDTYVDIAANRLHIMSQDAWAVGSPETVRIIRGTIAANNTAMAGAGFRVAWVAPGLCDVTFTRPFNGPPTVVASQQFRGNGTGGNPLDNAVIVFADARQARLKTGDAAGNPSNREFHFIAIGP